MNRKTIFANIILGSAVILFLLAFVLVLHKSSTSPSGSMIKYYIGLFVGVVLFACVLRCSTDVKANIALLLLSIVVIIYAVELYLSFKLLIYLKNNPDENPQSRIKFADAHGIAFDRRSLFQVVMDLRASGIVAYPAANPHNYIYPDGLNSQKAKVYPLGSMSDKTIVYCNEDGEYLINKSDEHGFDNPEGLYCKGCTDIVLIGDSFAHGHCVKSEENIAGWLRKSGKKVLNLGRGANGPLIELATMQEYAKPLRPKFVFWFYYEGNDQVDLKEEKKSSLLMKYMDGNYSQDLIDKQELIDSLIIEHVENKISSRKRDDKSNDKISKPDSNFSFLQIAKLSQLRERFREIEECFAPTDPLFEDILAEAKGRVNAWGGRLYFVYLPSIDRYLNESNRCTKYGYSMHREKILSIAKDQGLPVIDIQELLSSHPDVYSLFPFGLKFRGHFNTEGYRLVAQRLITRLQIDERH